LFAGVAAGVLSTLAQILLWAAAIHLALSITYSALLLPLAKRLTLVPSLLVGACFGASLYFFNLFGLTVVFGVTAMLCYGLNLRSRAWRRIDPDVRAVPPPQTKQSS
jgi:hypothetical protein